MTSIAKLKDRARKHEQKEDWEAAIKAYQEVLEKEEGADDFDLELSLYNRIGDLHLRLGHTDDAVSYYETAADKYAESGFLNNAIALCNKALRHRPDRPGIYLKLSRLCAEQGFQTDARRWILEYAERQMKAGQAEAAFTALEDFADLSGDPEVRATLAQQLAANDRVDDAIEELRKAYRSHTERGEDDAAAALVERAAAIDPAVDLAAEPMQAAGAEATEVGLEEASPGGVTTVEPEDEPQDQPEDEPEDEPQDQPEDEPQRAEESEEGLAGLETRREDVAADAEAHVQGVEGLESTALDPESESEGEDPVSGLEVSFAEQAPPAAPEDAAADALGGLETFEPAPSGRHGPEDEEEPEFQEEEPEFQEEEPEFQEEEPEPLPLIETGYDEEPEEEPEPLPLLDTGFDELEDASPVAGEDIEADDEEGGVLDLTGPEPAEEAEPTERVDAEQVADAMDLDLGSFDLGLDDEGESLVPPEDLDVAALLQRSREMVSRGLTDEALRELRLLSGSEAGPEAFGEALAVVNEVVRHDPNDLTALRRRVEYSARTGDRQLLLDAYIHLADALGRLGAETKAQAMYERVLGLDPENEVAREALGAEAIVEEEAIDLDAVLREMEPEEMEAPQDAADDPSFAAMLSKFKAKVTEPLESDEAGDHYDLGLAFKEMGLIDEAIAEFRTALRGGTERLKVYEELGQCFMQKGQYNVALKVFNRALKVPHSDGVELLGVYYQKGQCHEELGQRAEAREAYERVLAIDESFGDVPDRMARL